MANPITTTTSPICYRDKVVQLKECLGNSQSVLIITHDYPDPDCIASAFGISELFSFWGIPSTVISFGGFIGRAENRAMVRFLNISMVPFVLVDVLDFDSVVLVDSFPGKGNITLSKSITITAVIDHHPHNSSELPFFSDIRQEYGATSTIITKYLLEAGCPISPQCATALFYGIKTDTGEMRRDVSQDDLECYKFLFDSIDHKLFASIENPDRDVEYFRLLHRAAESAVTMKNLGYTHLGTVSTPDYVAEMTDLFHGLEQIEWMICSGIFKNQIFFSIRSKTLPAAGIYAEKLGESLGGSGGGHGRAAAGRVPITDIIPVNKIMENFEITLKELFKLINTEPKKLL